MKYLKRFNEGVYKLNINDIKQEANNYLAYLLDDENWSLNIDYLGAPILGVIDIKMIYYNGINRPRPIFSDWNDIKDYILPYLEHVNNIYNVNDFSCCYATRSIRYELEEDTFTLKQLNRKRKFSINELRFQILTND